MPKFLSVEITRKHKGRAGKIVVHATDGSAFDTEWGMEHFCWGENLRLDRWSANAILLTEKKFEFALNIAWDNVYRFVLRFKSGQTAEIEVVGVGLSAYKTVYEKNTILEPEGDLALSAPPEQ